MKRAIALVLTLTMLVSSLAACSSDDSSSTSSNTTTTTESTDTSTGITGFNVISVDDVEADMTAEPEGVQAGTSVALSSADDFISQLLPFAFGGAKGFYSQVFDALFYDDDNDGVTDAPLLVDSYTVSDDQYTWVLNLREDVYFHNGNKLTADSAIGSFAFYEEWDLVSFDTIDSIEATGEYQLTFQLNSVGPESPDFFALYVFDYTCYEEYGYTSEAAVGAGSGPYEIVDYALGDTVTLQAVEDFWDSSRQAHIETVTYKIISNTTTAFTALSAGELDYGQITDYSNYEMLVDSADHVILTDDGSNSIVWINADGLCEYLSNPVVREALCLMIDSEQVMMASSGGYGGNHYNCINTAFTYYEENRTYDPEAGLALLEAEGIDPSDIVLTALVSANNSSMFGNIQSQLMECGVTMNFTATDMNVVMTAGMAGEWDLWSEGGGLGAIASYSVSLTNLWGADAAQKVVTDPVVSVEVADLIAAGNSSTDLDFFYDCLAEICQILDENYVYLCHCYGVNWSCFSSNVANPVVDKSTNAWIIYESWIAE